MTKLFDKAIYLILFSKYRNVITFFILNVFLFNNIDVKLNAKVAKRKMCWKLKIVVFKSVNNKILKKRLHNKNAWSIIESVLSTPTF